MAGLSCLLLTASLGLCANAPAPAPGTATLTPQLGVGNLVFASKVLGGGGGALTVGKTGEGGRFVIEGAKGTLDIGGQTIAIAAQITARGEVGLGVDCKCKGSVDAKDFMMVKEGSASFIIKLPDGDKARDMGVTFSDLSIRAKNTTVTGIYGKATIACCMKGTIAGTEVRLLDENLDGKFTQDGKDSIVIGNAAAVPLLKKVCIGTTIYDLTVSPDGKTIDYAPADDVKTGIVELPIKSRALKGLVFASADGAYDLAALGKAGIPQGQYHFVYGLLAEGKELCPIEPTKSTPQYDIAAGSSNKLSFGPAYNVQFSASVADGKVSVGGGIQVVGAGGERYDVNFKTPALTPHVVLLQGDKQITNEAMGFG
jgi:hypothetical protein